jgi:hypothetical protein
VTLIVPKHLAKKAYKHKVVFWYQPKTQFLMCPPSPVAPPPTGFQRIECDNAAEVDMWSRRLRRQEQRLREMSDVERFEYESRVESDIIEDEAVSREIERLAQQAVHGARDPRRGGETRQAKTGCG